MKGQVARYVVNGVAATGVHFLALKLLIEHFELPSAGLSNLLAAVFGVSVSFLGNRLFVFPEQGKQGRLASQGLRFLASYCVIALVHGGVLSLWTDMAHWDYRYGFLVAMVFQVTLGYLANKYFVFKGNRTSDPAPQLTNDGASTETHLAP